MIEGSNGGEVRVQITEKPPQRVNSAGAEADWTED